MEKGHEGDQSDKKSEKQPSLIASWLNLKLQKALAHPLRRRILRTLNEHGATLNFRELATAIDSPAGLKLVSYHVHVLLDCGCVELLYAPKANGSLACQYTSNVADNPLILSLLEEFSDS